MPPKQPPFSTAKALAGIARDAPPSYAFEATDPTGARAWQRRARKALGQCLGFLDQSRVDPNPRTIQTVDRGSYVRKKIVLHTSAHDRMPVYILEPKEGSAPRPCVLALHGHGYGVNDIVGLFKDGTERREPEGYHVDFACALAERGFLVAAPEIAGFGERNPYHQPGSLRDDWPGCYRMAMDSLMLGGSILGLRVSDTMRLIDYLVSRPDVRDGSIGAMGLSGGGMLTYFAAAMDSRIRASVVSGYFCEWEGSIQGSDHCVCNFVPGVLQLGKLSDLAGLLAPRPLLVEHGTHDSGFLIRHVRQAVRRSRPAWEAFGHPEWLETDFFAGSHRIHGKKAYDFLQRHL
jgi:dienelactone hydrolase